MDAKEGPDGLTLRGLPLELEILESFARHGLLTIGPTDIQRLTGISKGSVSAKLKLLAGAGYLTQAEPGRYEPGPAMWDLAAGYIRAMLRQTQALHELSALTSSRIRVAAENLLGILPTSAPPSNGPSDGEA